MTQSPQATPGTRPAGIGAAGPGDTVRGMSYQIVLFPGRHHAVTTFQVDYLRRLLSGTEVDTTGTPIGLLPTTVVVWPITSASHGNTRRNPLTGSRRVGLVESVSTAARLPSLVLEVPDVPAHPRFAELVVTTVNTELLHLGGARPENTIVACSTPAVAAEYAALGYRIAPVENGLTPRPAGPWQVVERCAAGDPTWTDLSHPASVSYWRRNGIPGKVRALFADPVVSDEGDLTATRDYRTYAASFENASLRKWDQVAPHLEPGRLLDIGCATGGLLEQAAADPRFAESDLFGVDVARPLLAEAEHKKAAGVFANPNIWFVRANALTGPVMPERSMNSTVTVALTHEIASYGDGVASLTTLSARIYAHTAARGVWVNSDVLGPTDPDRLVTLTLDAGDGRHQRAPFEDLENLTGDQVKDKVSALSTDSRMRQFAYDFPRLSGAKFAPTDRGHGEWLLTLGEAMEFMTRKDYTDNWLSECHERFCDLSYADWVDVLTGTGFTLAPASGPVRNDWLVEHRFNPVATLYDALTGDSLEWPHTHVLTVAVRTTAE